MSTLAVGSSITIPLQGGEVFTITSQLNTIFRATFTPLANQIPTSGGGRSYGPQAQALTLGPFGVPGTLVLENQQSTAGSTLTYTQTAGYSQPYVLSQSAVPVMIPQTSAIASSATVPPGVATAASVTLSSATAGSVTVTMGSAVLAGTSADVGKQITFYDNAGGFYRSLLITAAGTTTTCTATLSSTASGVGPHSTSNYLGYALPANYTTGVWVYWPAGAVVGGSAGFYYCVPAFTATANGFLQITTAYQATMTTPTIPTGYSNAVGGNGNYSAPTATTITLASATLSGGAMGSNGGLRQSSIWAMTNNANGKGMQCLFGGNIFGLNNTQSSIATQYSQSILFNRGSQNAQVAPNVMPFPGTAVASAYYYSVNTAQAQTLSYVGIINVATDYLVLDGYTFEVLPGF